jgi:hypothetical protein
MPTKNRQKMLLIGACVVIGLWIGDNFIITPLIHSWKDRAAYIENLRRQVANGSYILSRQGSIQSQWDIMRTNALPSNVSLAQAQLLKSFDHWERTSGLNRVSIKPNWKQEDNYMTLECRADYTGDMNRVRSFLYEIEKDPIGVKIEDVEISTHDDSGRVLSLGVQLSGLMLNPPSQSEQP